MWRPLAIGLLDWDRCSPNIPTEKYINKKSPCQDSRTLIAQVDKNPTNVTRVWLLNKGMGKIPHKYRAMPSAPPPLDRLPLVGEGSDEVGVAHRRERPKQEPLGH